MEKLDPESRGAITAAAFRDFLAPLGGTAPEAKDIYTHYTYVYIYIYI